MRKSIALASLLLLSNLVTAQSALKPATITADQLKQLRWIEGSWRGTGGGIPPFFERYRFESATVLLVEHLDNGKVASTSRYELTDGQFASGTGNGRAVATLFDDKGITFEFAARERGGYRWQRDTADTWKAILTWPASGTRAAGERVYTLERMPK